MQGNSSVREYDPKVERIIVAASEFCSDSRNTTEPYYSAKQDVLAGLKENGVLVDFFRMNDPGTFVTPLAAAEFMFHFMQKKIEYSQFMQAGVPIEFHLYIVGHANARHTAEFRGKHTFNANSLEVAQCCTNCGMAHAIDAARGLQDYLVSIRPEFNMHGKAITISTHDDLFAYNRAIYGERGAPEGWDGNFATWIRPISDFRSHPLEQIKAFEQEAAANPFFHREIPEVKTYGYVLNYTNNNFYRVDGKPCQEDMVLRPIFKKIRESPARPADHETRIAKQANDRTPILLVSDPYVPNARKEFAEKVHRMPYRAGLIFAESRMVIPGAFDLPTIVGMGYNLLPTFLNKHNQGALGVVGSGIGGQYAVLKKICHDQIANKLVGTQVASTTAAIGVVDNRQFFPAVNPNLNRFIRKSMQARRC